MVSAAIDQHARRELVSDGAVTIPTACQIAGVSRATIWRRIASGELASIRIGRRRLIPRRALLDYLARGLEPRANARGPETR